MSPVDHHFGMPLWHVAYTYAITCVHYYSLIAFLPVYTLFQSGIGEEAIWLPLNIGFHKGKIRNLIIRETLEICFCSHYLI